MGESINPRPLFAAPILLAGMASGAYLMRDYLGLDKIVARIYPNLDGVSSSFIHVYRPTDESLIILRKANSVSELTGRGGSKFGELRDAIRSARAPSEDLGRFKPAGGSSYGSVRSVLSGGQDAKPLFKAVENFVPVRRFPSRAAPIYDRRPSPWQSGGGRTDTGILRGGVRIPGGGSQFARSGLRGDSGPSDRSGVGRSSDAFGDGDDPAEVDRIGQQAKAMLGRAAATGVLGPSAPAMNNAHEAAVASSQYAARLAGDVAAKAPPEAQHDAQLALQLSNQAVDAARSGDHRSAAALDDQALKHLQQVAAIQKALREGNADPTRPQGGQQ